MTAAQTRAAAEAAAAAGVPFQVAYWRRYVPALQELRERMAAGELGDVHLVDLLPVGRSRRRPAFRAHSGGIFVDMGVHEFDQLRWLTGQDIAGLSAVASGLVPGGLGEPPDQAPDVDSAQVIAQLSGGATGFISLGRYFPGGRHGAGRGRSAPAAPCAATSSTRRRASGPSWRRCGGRPRASPRSPAAARARAPPAPTRSRR